MSEPDQPPPGWRVVEPGERIEPSDVTQDWLTRRLLPVPDWCVGLQAKTIGNRVYRRDGETLPTDHPARGDEHGMGQRASD